MWCFSWFTPGWNTDRSMWGMCHIPVTFLNHKNSEENKTMWIDPGGIMWFPLNMVFGHHWQTTVVAWRLGFLTHDSKHMNNGSFLIKTSMSYPWCALLHPPREPLTEGTTGLPTIPWDVYLQHLSRTHHCHLSYWAVILGCCWLPPLTSLFTMRVLVNCRFAEMGNIILNLSDNQISLRGSDKILPG